MAFFLSNGCPLCGKNHEVCFYIYVERSVQISIDKIIKIKVIRIFCHNNYIIRRETGGLLQYTVTILPAFLIPHSKVPVDAVFYAYSYYLKKKCNQFEAAQIMFCQSNHSFGTYYKRISVNLDSWQNYFIRRPDKSIAATIKEKWHSLEKTMKDLASPGYSEFWSEYAHSHLCLNKMGLGP